MAYTDINSDDSLLLAFLKQPFQRFQPKGLKTGAIVEGELTQLMVQFGWEPEQHPFRCTRAGYCSASSGRCAYQHRPLYAQRQKGWFYDSSSVKAPCIHSNSSLISDAALPFGADSDTDNPDVKAWTCSIL